MKEVKAGAADAESLFEDAERRLRASRETLGIPTGCATVTPSTPSNPSTPGTPSTQKARYRELEQEENKGKDVPEGWYLHDDHCTIDLQLEAYTSWAIEKGVSYFEEREDEEYEARCEGYLGPCFGFAVYMKSRPEFQGMGGMEAANTVTGLLERLAPNSKDPWKKLLPDHDIMGNEIDPYTHFIDSWVRVTKPLDEAAIEKATRLAKQYPLLNKGMKSRRQRPYRDIVSLMYWLQIVAGDGDFFLSCRQAGEFAGIAHTNANVWIRQAKRDKLIQVVKPAIGRDATTYKLNLELVSCLRMDQRSRSESPKG